MADRTARGSAEILAYADGRYLENTLEVIEIGGRTCYKSFDKITPVSAEKFIKQIIKRTHESVIEHSWFTFGIGSVRSEILLDALMKVGLFSLTKNYQGYILSGNARMFRDYLRRSDLNGDNFALLLMAEMQKMPFFPVLFGDLGFDWERIKAFAGSDAGRDMENIITINPTWDFTREEKLAHYWAMARFKGYSRAFTHQLVRHRLAAISQESQRYCDEAGFYGNDYFVTPPSFVENDYGDWYDAKMRELDDWYRKAREELRDDKGQPVIRKEDARFLLPNAVCSEIVMSANLEEWRWILKKRCDKAAQWEIREAAMDLLWQFRAIFPDCFDDFAISEDGESAHCNNI